MTTTQLKAEAAARGFTHAVTMAGPIPLDAWDPYGRFGVNRPKNQPDYDPEIHTWEWIDHERAADTPNTAPPFVSGVWRFSR